MSQSLRRIRIDQINIGHRFRKELGPLDGLGTSIRERGLMQPIVVCEVPGGYRLIAGERRFRAVRDLGESMIDAKVYDAKDELTLRLMERDENAERKEMTPSEKVALGKEIERLLGERRGRPGKSEKTNENGDEKVRQMAHISGKRNAEVAAEAVGFDSTRTYQRAKNVADNGAPETVQAMDEGTITVSDASVISDEPAAVQKEAIAEVKKGNAKTAAEAVRKKQGRMVYDDRKPRTPSKNGKGGKKKEQLLPYPDDAKIDRIFEEAAAALEARQQAFGHTPELKAIIDDLDALTARWHEFAGKPAPEQEIVPDELDTDEFRALWEEWKKYRKEKKNRLSPTTRQRQLKELAGWGLEAAIKSMEKSMTKGWTGLFEPDGNTKATHDKKHDAEAEDAWLERTAQRRREQGIQA